MTVLLNAERRRLTLDARFPIGVEKSVVRGQLIVELGNHLIPPNAANSAFLCSTSMARKPACFNRCS